MDINRIKENATRLGMKTSSSKMLIKALDILKLKKENRLRKSLFIIVELLITVGLLISDNTIIIFSEILNLTNAALMTFFAVVFTGYTFFQMLVGDRLLLVLVHESVEEDGKEKSHLENTIYYFTQVMLLQFLLILLNLVCIIVLKIIFELKYMLILLSFFKWIVGLFFICVLLHFNFEVMWEIKSFIFNVFQIFNMHAMVRIIDIIKRDENKES